MRLTWLTIAAGCSEYELMGELPEVEPPEETPSLPEPPPAEPPAPPPEPTCADVVLPEPVWVASAPFADPMDPTDSVGRPFWDPLADRTGWEAIVLPDRAIPALTDRAYVGTFTLGAVPWQTSLSLQSDDGLEVWVNGVALGAWGGSWQMEGCVNDHAQCLVTTDVPPIDVTALLVVGENVVAARVSNPVANAWFEILPTCVDGPG